MTNCNSCGRRLYPWNDTGTCVEPKTCRLLPSSQEHVKLDKRKLPWGMYTNNRSLYFVRPEDRADRDWWMVDDYDS
jgi:hypothetical protein